MCFNMIIFLLVLYMAINSGISIWWKWENPFTETTNTLIEANSNDTFPMPFLTIVSKNPSSGLLYHLYDKTKIKIHIMVISKSMIDGRLTESH